MVNKLKRKIVLMNIVFMLSGILFVACEPLAVPPDMPVFPSEILQLLTPSPEPEATEKILEMAMPIPELTETPTHEPEGDTPKIWRNENLPDRIKNALSKTDVFTITENQAEADYKLNYLKEGGQSEWVFALVAPFKTLTDEVGFAQFEAFWKGSDDFPAKSLVMNKEALEAMKALLGDPVVEVHMVMCFEEFIEKFHGTSDTWAVLEFEHLREFYKVIAIDGQSPVRKDFDPQSYPLTVSIGLEQVNATDALLEEYEALKARLAEGLPATNREANKLTTVVMTGVTAMVRATAKEMEIKGVLYPGESVRKLLREADITHISNEIPFYNQCPEPQWTQENLVFCSNPRYIDLLLDIGADVIDLTGDHFQDYGAEAMHQTLDIYQAHNLPYFGGGRNIDQARTPVKFEVNGNKIAFLGCNGKAPGDDTASETNPGAYHCNMEDMVVAIDKLITEGYLPIVTFQHYEYYHWAAEPYLVEDFRRVAEAGAVAVSGSQGHQPHAYEFHEGAFIHYGLGNLFFDQLTTYADTDKAFIDRLVFYDGRLISVELITTRFYDWSKPVIVYGEDRIEMLEKLFEYSDWEEK